MLFASAAHAAGLGRLTVLSALGQPLRAEIELTAVSTEEANGLVAKLANPDAFRAANIDFNPALLSLRFAVEQRSGRQIVRISSTQPINEPFVDMLLELSWNSGRLVREYTFLLDPAELRTTQSAQVAAGAAANAARQRAQQAAPQQGASPAPTPAPAAAARAERPARPADAGAPDAKTLTEYRVKRGDTLGRIAAQVKPVDVSLDMMLVALYRANPDAFLGNNMNRLKSGQILSVPDSDALRGASKGDAHGVVVAHAADFNAYRNKLAGQVASSAPAKEPEATQSGAGKVTAKVQESATAANEAADKLRLSKAAPGATAGKAGGGAEDKIAREKEVAEATARVKELERNVSELEKLTAVKNKAAADAAAAAAATPAPVTPAVPVAVTPLDAPAVAPAPVALPKAPIVKKPVAPVVPEAGLVETIMDNILAIGAGLLVLLLAAFAVIQRKKKNAAAEPGPSSLLGAASQPAHSMYDEAGGQSVDTNNSVFNSSFSPSASQLDTNEVDPVAEADVYIAYGRDAQAEEILREALRTNPERYPVRLKLLEIYAARKDLRSFETQAGELYSMTRGQGEEWQQAAAMGLLIDPANPLYGAGEQPLNLGLAAGAAVAGAAASQSDLAQQLAASFASSGAQPESAHFDLHALESSELTALPQAAPLTDDNALDFDLGGLDFEPVSAAPAPAEVTYATPATAAAFEATAVPDMAFHSAADDVPAPEQAAVEADPFDIDFDMNFDAPAPAPAPAAAPLADFDLQSLPGQPAAAPAFDLGAMNFDLPETPAAAPVALTKPAALDTSFLQDDLPTLAPAPERSAAAPAFDMSNIDLDLPASAAPTAGRDDTFGVGFPFDEPATTAAEPDNSGNSVMSSALMEMETKLDLAIAYQEIGDKEGARELLDEVIKGGNSEQVTKANAMRAQLA
ncbi:FimV/HubP family polar landmark protein [Massilia sp. S19_KUP03_FR1]|uniref:FimV/HubP family polar landmark protein n=1 Tax=Massilia sp. S19_KUP03_FR1 TaxID=3025503 RepID=UPI002FCD6883